MESHWHHVGTLDPDSTPRCDGKFRRVLQNSAYCTIDPKSLRVLGNHLIPSTDQTSRVNATIELVRDALRRASLNVDRICVSGSFGKKTAVAEFGVDLVVFLNDEEPPFERSLQRWNTELPKLLRSGQLTSTTPRGSVQFVVNGFNVDLMPATNYAERVPPESSKTHVQERSVLNQLRRMPLESIARDMGSVWGPALAEVTVDYMNNQQPFVKAALRLVKLWKWCRMSPSTSINNNNNTTLTTVWFTSYMLETLVVAVAVDELKHNPHRASLVRVLIHVFQALTKPDRLCVVHPHREENIPPSIYNKERPLVLDPIHPYGNVAAQMGPTDWNLVVAVASTSLYILHRPYPHPTIGELFDCWNYL